MDIHIANQETFQKKIDQIKADGTKNLHVISDFDRTLTTAYVNGKKMRSSYSLIREGNYLSPEYVKKAFYLFDEYHPYEIGQKISDEERNVKMIEWWTKHFALMKECGLNEEIFDDIIAKNKMNSRKGLTTFFNLLENKNIPLLIFSAGLGNLISKFLNSKNLITPNVHIIANFYNFEKGELKGTQGKFIHTFNKNEYEIKDTKYYQEIQQRKNVILLGDSLGDLGMTEGIEHDTILKIGFLNYDNDESLQVYKEKFDILILHDGTLDKVNEIIESL